MIVPEGSFTGIHGSSDFKAMRDHFQPSFSPASASAGDTLQPVSMADTLRSTFGDGSMLGDKASAHVAAAYGKFRSFAL